jgi:hypothetical protein
MKKKIFHLALLAAVLGMLSTGCGAPHKALPSPPAAPVH